MKKLTKKDIILALFLIYSILPFFLLYEESFWFWLPWFLAFLGVNFCKKEAKPKEMIFWFSLGIFTGAIIYFLHNKIILLFWGRILLFMLLGLLRQPFKTEIVLTIYFISFVLVLIAASLTFQVWFAIYLFFYSWFLMYMLLSLQFPKYSLSRAGLIFYSFKVSFFMLLLGYLIFLFFPRLNISRFYDGLSISGFSDSVDFSDLTNLLQSEQVVMRVYTDKPQKLIGAYLDYFDGISWKNTQEFVPIRRGLNNEAHLPLYRFLESNNSHFFKIELMPTKQRQLFKPALAATIQSDLNIFINRFGALKRDTSPYAIPFHYQIESLNLKKPLPMRQSPALKNKYLQLPKSIDPRITKLAFDLTKDFKTDIEKAKALERFFHQEFTYSLNSYHPGDKMLDFILNNRSGHCEYFASAMVLMLRIIGIPARMVTGFLEGEKNPIGNYYTIRAKDAHAWVEVYLGDFVYLDFDPTTARGSNWFFKDIFLFKQLGFYLEYLDNQWQSYILYFDRFNQELLLLWLKAIYQKNKPLFFFLLVSFFLGIFIFITYYFKSFKTEIPKNIWLKRLDKLLLQINILRACGCQPADLVLPDQYKSLNPYLKDFQNKLYQKQFANLKTDLELAKLLKVIKIELLKIKKYK